MYFTTSRSDKEDARNGLATKKAFKHITVGPKIPKLEFWLIDRRSQ
jgi:hypothetical protein